ncbi:MAG: heavy metal translocating P-type ATPase [Chloroflexi bacterium]|nr:heavy metal translocating P-type ATPase [Chloroflexota bacterium]
MSAVVAAASALRAPPRIGTPRQPNVRSLPLEAEVVHAIAGRVRLRVPAVKYDASLGDRLVDFVQRQPGVVEARANSACAALIVAFDPEATTTSAILTSVRGGVPLEPVRARGANEPDRTSLVCGVLALGLGVLGAPALLTGGLLAASAVPVFGRALAGIRDEHKLSADALDAVAISVLAAQGGFVAAALSASLIAGGEYIRGLTARRSHGALSTLLAASGQSAWVLRGSRKERVPADALVPGDVIVVYPGELVVADGLAMRGRATVDQKTLTGESTPVLKVSGMPVYASTVVLDGKLYVRVEQVGARTRASRIVRLLEDAPMHDTRLANHARLFADRLVLPTFALAGGLLIATGDIQRAVSVLIIDFVTGIRVSAPTTVLASMTAGVHRDILVKGGRALEQLAVVDTLVFDKTGTLTSGAPRVTDVRAFATGLGRADILALAASVERRLTHPAAQAIVRAAEAEAIPIPERGDSHFAVGLGVRSDVEGRETLVGSTLFLRRHGVTLSPAALAFANAAGDRGASTAFVARDHELIGAVCYTDTPRPEARAVLERLRGRGLTELVMLTGDNARVARSVARELGIERVEADAFPERKAELVSELKAAGRKVAVVGDGINDSPALAYADVAISLETASDVARETADIVLHGDLHGLPDAIDLARESLRLIRQNLAIVAVPNAAGMALATLGLLGPVAATAINNGSSVAAALNGLRPLLTAR